MKNKKQKTPKLPKYEYGDMHETMHSNEQSGTQNIYNNKRSFGKNIGNYAGYAQAGLGTASNLAAINEQDYNGDTKAAYQSQAIGDGITQGMGALSPYIAMGTGIRKSATGMIGDKSGANRTVSNWMAAPHEAASSDIAAANNSENTQSQKIGGYMSAIGDITGMSKMRQMFSYGTGNDEKTTGFWGKYNDLTGITARNNQKASMQENQFAGGGMNIQPNAEVEGGGYGKDGENTLNPDGTATQFNGPTHEQGGIKTNLDPGTLIFSDKVKWDGKTAADHNKPYTRIIQKATKDLENSSLTKESKLSAHLNLMAATKASQAIFAKQEETKQSRIDSYTKRLGGIMKYPNGGLTPQQYKQAQSDSLTLYKAGLQSNKKPYYDYPGTTEAMQRLQEINSTNNRIVAPEAIQGEAYGNQPGYNGGYNVKFQKPTMLPYKQIQTPLDNNGVQRVENYAQPIGKPVQHPNYNQFIPGVNQSKQPIQTEEFKKGGIKGKYKAPVAEYNPEDDVVVPGKYTKSNTDFSGVLAPSTYDNQMDVTDANTLNNSAYAADYLNNPNAPKPSSDNSGQGNKFDWKGLGTQAAYFAANNAGNLYDLARANKTETRKYNRATENLVTPNFRDADQKYLYMKNALKGASLGASGYLANLQQAHVNNVLNKAQIQQAADNTNAGIKNQVSQYNTGIAKEEILANAKITANARNIKQSAIASIGSNSANQMNDVRNTEMDKKKMDGLIKMYPSLSKDPNMLEYFYEF